MYKLKAITELYYSIYIAARAGKYFLLEIFIGNNVFPEISVFYTNLIANEKNFGFRLIGNNEKICISVPVISRFYYIFTEKIRIAMAILVCAIKGMYVLLHGHTWVKEYFKHIRLIIFCMIRKALHVVIS